MVSICIPIYNFDVTNLVTELSIQSERLNVPSEIILIDDCSKAYFRSVNEIICSKHTYIKLSVNIGRAAIRNKFLDYATYDYLLFLDCDSIVNVDNFLEVYILEIQKKCQTVICGGRMFENIKPPRDKMLKWKYGLKKESKPFDVRRLHPNKSFMTNNFIISKKVLETVGFDQRILDYGHEDTLFGYELKKRNIVILHINNPVLNGDLEDNKDYILSNEKAIGNLIKILGYIEYDQAFIEDVALLSFYFKHNKLRRLIIIIYKVFKLPIKYLLSKGYVCLYLFDFYKLGYLSVKMNTKTN